MLPPLENPDRPEGLSYDRASSSTDISPQGTPATSIVPSMPDADMSPSNSARASAPTTAHTATTAAEYEDPHVPAWVRMLLEQQANAHRVMAEQHANTNRIMAEQQASANRAMEGRQASMLEQQANTFCLLEGLFVGQDPHNQHARTMPVRNPSPDPHFPYYANEVRDFEHSARDERNYAHSSQAPQLLVKEHHSLKPEEIAIFNPSTGDDIEVFCRRIQDMAAVKG